MQKPMVCRQLMAMNESVAASCCYRQVATPTHYYTEVLHGGQIESGPKNMRSWNPAIAKDWALLPFDIDFSAYQGPQAVPYFNPRRGGWGVLCLNDAGAIVADTMLDAFIADPGVNVSLQNDGCAHASNACLYLTEMDSAADNNHVGANDAHDTAGTSWQSPHPALQFNS